MSGKLYIKSDKREDDGALPILDDAAEMNNIKNKKMVRIELLEEQMSIGDYSILFESKYLSKHFIIGAVFERKTWKDLSASIKEVRMNRQYKNMEELRDKTGCQIYYIIEGETRGKYSKGSEVEGLKTKIRRNMIRGVPYIRTRNQSETAKLLVDMARDMHILYCNGEIEFPDQEPYNNTAPDYDVADIQPLLDKYKDTPLFLELQKIATKMSLTLPHYITPEKENHKPPPLSVDDIEMLMWRSFPKVGPSLGEALYSKYKFKEVMINKPNLLAENILLPNGRKPDRSALEMFMNLIDDKEQHAKIIGCINRVTVEAAQKILEHFTIEQLMSGTADVDEIAQIAFKNNRIGYRAKLVVDTFAGMR